MRKRRSDGEGRGGREVMRRSVGLAADQRAGWAAVVNIPAAHSHIFISSLAGPPSDTTHTQGMSDHTHTHA